MNIEQERNEFEAWYRLHHGSRDVYGRDASGEYADKQVQGAFNVWQARAALAAEQQPTEGEEIMVNTPHGVFTLPVEDQQCRSRFESGYGGMSLRDAMAMSVRIPDDYSVKWGEALIGEQAPNSVEPVAVHIDWWMRVEAAYRYRMADAMLKAREVSND